MGLILTAFDVMLFLVDNVLDPFLNSFTHDSNGPIASSDQFTSVEEAV